MDRWGPMFAVQLGIPWYHLTELSIPQMVDHIDYANEMRGPVNG